MRNNNITNVINNLQMTENQLESFASRLKQIRRSLNLSQAELAEKLDIKQSQISNYERGERNITPAITLSLIDNLNINRKWWETGEGDMFLPKIQREGSPGELERHEFIDLADGQILMLVPLVDEYAYAGYLAGFKDEEYVDELPKHSIIVNRYHKGTYRSFRAVGDSMTSSDVSLMESNIYDGNIVTGREIAKVHWKYRLHTHKFSDYVIVHKDGILIKRVIFHDTDNGTLTLHSLNENKDLYPDFEVSLDDVYQIFNIVDVHQKR